MKEDKTPITKQEAINLWEEFIRSPKVLQTTNGYGPGKHVQYTLVLEQDNKQVLGRMNLVTCGPGFEIKGSSLKTLFTPYGSFELTIEEANELRDQWKNRQITGVLPIHELLKALR